MIPVTVRLSNSSVDVHVTNRLSGLSWRSVSPGGYGPATFSLHSPIDVRDPMLEPYTRVYIYDGRDGETLWEGRLQFPGRSADDTGQVWALTGLGPASHALDDMASLIYVDRDLTSMHRNNSSPAAEANVGEDPGNAANEDALVLRFPNGITVNTNTNIAMTYERIAQANMLVGGVTYDWDAGFTNANFENQLVLTPSTAVVNDACNVAGGTHVGLSAGGTFGTDHTLLTFRLIRIAGGALAISGDLTWASFADIAIRGQLVSKTGAAITGAGTYSNPYIFAHEVVADLLGRMLPWYDGAGAVIEATAEHIDQLAYPDPVRPDQVLADLMIQEPAYTWHAWESDPVTGLYRFEWKALAVSARYEATVEDGFDSPTAQLEQYNKALVRWMNPKGSIRTGVMTSSTVAELEAAGLVRAGFLDLSDESGSAANAIRAGNGFLQDHNRPPSGGTLTVARPILDLIDGRQVMPWQIRPGELVRVRGVEASIDTVVNSRDGATVFRVVAVEVGDDGVARLELDMFTRTEARALAELLKRRNRKR